VPRLRAALLACVHSSVAVQLRLGVAPGCWSVYRCEGQAWLACPAPPPPPPLLVTLHPPQPMRKHATVTPHPSPPPRAQGLRLLLARGRPPVLAPGAEPPHIGGSHSRAGELCVVLRLLRDTAFRVRTGRAGCRRSFLLRVHVCVCVSVSVGGYSFFSLPLRPVQFTTHHINILSTPPFPPPL
jgi:hypothetical protein